MLGRDVSRILSKIYDGAFLLNRSGMDKLNGQTKWMYFRIENDDLLNKCNPIWNKVSADIKNEFDSEPVYCKKILKTKIKSHSDEVTDF